MKGKLTILMIIIMTAFASDEKYAIIGFGSPIVDSIISYELNPELGENIKNTLSYHMDKNFPVEFYQSVINSDKADLFLGGSAMNTIRVVNFIIKSKIPNKVGFIGSIGDDSLGDFISNGLSLEGIDFNKEVLQGERTSTCIVLIEKHERSFFSDLASSNKVTIGHLESMTEKIANSKIFYADAYLIGSRFDLFKHVYEKYYDTENIISINFASHYVIRDYFMNFVSLLPYLDLIFLNEEEFATLRQGFNIELNDIEFLIYLQQYEHKSDKKQRIIVNTNGARDTLIASNDGVFRIPVFKVKDEDIVDTNGAGDSFSGGFLAGLLMGYSIEESAKIGNYIASKVIMLKGFQIPSDIDTEHLLLLSLKDDWNVYS